MPQPWVISYTEAPEPVPLPPSFSHLTRRHRMHLIICSIKQSMRASYRYHLQMQRWTSNRRHHLDFMAQLLHGASTECSADGGKREGRELIAVNGGPVTGETESISLLF